MDSAKESFKNLVSVIDSQSSFKTIITKPEKSSLLLEYFVKIIHEYELPEMDDETQTHLLNFIRLYTDLEESNFRRDSFAICCKMLPFFYESMKRPESYQILSNFMFISDNIDYSRTLLYVERLFGVMLYMTNYNLAYFWNFLFENVFNRFFLYETDSIKGDDMKHNDKWNQSYLLQANAYIGKFIFELMEVQHQFKPFLTENKYVLMGLIKFSMDLAPDQLLKILGSYFQSNLICSNQQFTELQGMERFIPAAYVCNYDSSVNTILLNIINALPIEYIATILMLLIRLINSRIPKSDIMRPIKTVVVVHCMCNQIIANYSKKEELLLLAIPQILQLKTTQTQLILFYCLVDSKLVSEKVISEFWNSEFLQEDFKIILAQLLTMHMFPELLSIDLSKLIAFSKTYGSTSQKARDRKLSPIFLEKLSLMETDPTIFLTTAFQWSGYSTKFFIPSSLRLNWNSEQKLKLFNDILDHAIVNKDVTYLKYVVNALTEIIYNIPYEFEFSMQLVYDKILPILDINEIDVSFAYSLFRANTKLLDSHWDKFVKRMIQKLSRDLTDIDLLLYISENLSLLETKLKSKEIINLIVINLERIKNVTVNHQQAISICALMTSIYSILLNENSPDRFKPISYLDDFCLVNKNMNLVQEQVLVHYLCINDVELAKYVNCNTLFDQFTGAPDAYWAFLHMILSDQTNIEKPFPDFLENAIKLLIKILKISQLTSFSEYLSSLCVDIIIKSINLYEIFEKEAPNFVNNDIVMIIRDTVLSKYTDCEKSGFPNHKNPQYEIFEDKFALCEKNNDDTFSVSTKHAISASSYKLHFDDAKESENSTETEVKTHDFSRLTIPNFDKFISNFAGYQPSIPPKSMNSSYIPTTSFPQIKFPEVQGAIPPSSSAEITTIPESKQWIPQQNIGSIFGGIIDTKFTIRAQNKALERESRALFETLQKLTCKIGIIYVKKGKILQSDILAMENKDTTEQYQKFLSEMGQIIFLKNFKSYCGKLDTIENRNGVQSLYFTDKRLETMFHVSTMMPTKQGDSQQIQKKKHVGNDNSLVVWNENIDIPWNTATIVSQFNDHHVVVFPLSDSLYFVDVRKKSDALETGPIRHPVILHHSSCPALVRWTAILSDFLVRGFSNPLDSPHQKVLLQLSSMVTLIDKN
ncbi:Rap/ran-GAP family protein [Trichomonas vaginalis G3]|uniref:Rap/ran-GAP family protein n=1 Tax=Trichomonas vaginalis (strain ATCC PRA-98 / G3) TaxID=412133 RepID=A2DW93_TRIV3|nr:GTPase activator protein [Trichomonas vaginalis G3]EAY15394.1 Rap/ran-GAP family protein [Trichomonas vaginalis G3]KAI5496731.1 GTPase activator protein [Trichomonas vaginalis G3]|eukprot:XP_001327617.1 Rap/ran-GAP family protein [Trichomonas vaginalis G3]